DQESTSFFYKRRLPHLFQQNHPVFITWGIKFHLPEHIKNHLHQLKIEFEQSCKNMSNEYRLLMATSYHKKIFDWYDTQMGVIKEVPDILIQPGVSEIIKKCLLFDNEKKYCLNAYCIMPNHVHVLITPYANPESYKNSLSSITKSWKGYSAKIINQELNRKGAFWNRESYDHLVRNENEFFRIVNYIIQNPVKAHLVANYQDWEYTWVSEDIIEQMML
ncbi:MAG TPA: transposase, partial [Candidatus Cloacimonadota bacterium]|nr:transposase [Candidatus Cloacimonadota bacterium]